MTVCNMSIEWGAKAGLIAPDQTTFDYIEGRPEAPKGADWDAAVAHWKTLVTDDDAVFDEEIVLDASTMTPFVTWGTNPGQGAPLGASVPSPDDFDEPNDKVATEKALHYMGLEAGTPLGDVELPTTGEIVVVVGPEGGISPAEVERFTAAGGRLVRPRRGRARRGGGGARRPGP